MIDEKARKKDIFRVTWIGFFVNLVLTTAKFAAGIVGRSGAMIADAVHSLSDFATDVVVLLFINISSKPKDEDHDYGHGKYETLATVIIGTALAAVGIKIFGDAAASIYRVIQGQPIDRPGLIAFAAAGLSIIVKELLYRYTLRSGIRWNSSAVIANAWHHRSDAFSSIGTLIGIGGAYFLGDKWCILDPIAAIIVSILIIKVSLELMQPGLNELLEKSLPKEVEEQVFLIIREFSEIESPHNLKSRAIGSVLAFEVHIRVAGDMSVARSHSLTVALEKKLRDKFGGRTQIIIHVEPRK